AWRRTYRPPSARCCAKSTWYRLLPAYHGTRKNRGDAIARCAAVFVPGDDQQAVVGLSPVGVGFDIARHPGIGLGDGAVVHVVLLVGNDDADLRQKIENGRKCREGLIERGSQLVWAGCIRLPVDPWIVLAPVVAALGDR